MQIAMHLSQAFGKRRPDIRVDLGMQGSHWEADLSTTDTTSTILITDIEGVRQPNDRDNDEPTSRARVYAR
ncbi:hypothetical protein K0M31_008637 [Melipona bicolor]|uniref:Uncharacterized protein n=1 Tax=Melipona bicolor TaxID=60889 RepID=A0AA40KJX1_9HYME|nr:hypothetical protein K0M31_008637 [Melipona bicolor]